MLELPVLGLLKEREMHGYELRKQLGAMLGPFWQVSWGSLYPTLRRLAKAGAVEKLETEGTKPRRTTRSTRTKSTRSATRSSRATTKATLPTGRRKNVYRITDAGEELFISLLEETAAAVDAEHFTLKLAFFRYMKPEMRLVLLERRRAYLTQKLNEFKENLKQYRERMDSYALSLQNHDMATTESDLAFIDELINRERAIDVARPNTSHV
jgi:DNA-binding PadR family transcriptional regulator